MKALQGRIAIVTGASSGIGAATARALAAHGANIALVARREDRLVALAEEIRGLGAESLVAAADVARESSAFGVVDRVLAAFGLVDVLVNSAGIIRPGTIAAAEPAHWRDTLDINLLAPMYLSQAVLRSMLPRESGHIVNVSSNAARRPGSPGNNAYSASKYGMTGFSDALRLEVGPMGIRVTLVEPGATATDVHESIPDEAARRFMQEHLHRPTVLQAEDVAAAICFAVCQPPRVNVDNIWLTPTRS